LAGLNQVIIPNRLMAFDNSPGKTIKDRRRKRAYIGLPDRAFFDLAINPIDQVLGKPFGKSGLSGPGGARCRRLIIRLQPTLNPWR
jgi:hypothetical protein